MADELDLERGDPAAADAISSRSQRRQRRRETAAGDTPPKRETDKTDGELSSRLDRTFDRIAEWRESRGDEELATVITEDKRQLSGGVVSITHVAPFLRMPFLMFLNLLEPVLAFSRVGRILIRRGLERRERKMAEREAAMQEQEYSIPDAEVVG